MDLTPARLASFLDSTQLRLDATRADIVSLCEEAARHRFACVMIYPADVPLATTALAGTGIRIATVVGFPSGRFSTAAKAAEIDAASAAGAHEVDIVMNHAALRNGDAGLVEAELRSLCRIARERGQLAKIIVETCYLDSEQRMTALHLCEEAGADFIKTSTGFGAAGAQVADIAAWAAARRGAIQLKASGGIKTLGDARAFLAVGATRLGTSNATAILAELEGAAPASGDAGSY